jgi:hypothetical protein
VRHVSTANCSSSGLASLNEPLSSKGEHALLLAFLEAPQRPLSREHLLQATRIHEDIFDRSIDVQELRLRRKLETDPSAPRVIQTERGVGLRVRAAGRAVLKVIKMWRFVITVVIELSAPRDDPVTGGQQSLRID